MDPRRDKEKWGEEEPRIEKTDVEWKVWVYGRIYEKTDGR